MPLNQTQVQVVGEWLRSRAGALICPVCAWQEAFVHDELVAAWPLAYMPDQGERLDRSHAVPMVAVACRNCGHLRFFSAVVMGLVAPPRIDVPTPQPGDARRE